MSSYSKKLIKKGGTSSGYWNLKFHHQKRKHQELSRMSSSDRKVQAAMRLHETSDRPQDLYKELDVVIGTVSDPSTSVRVKRNKMMTWNQSLKPYIEQVSSVLKEDGKILSPVPGTSDLHIQQERARRREVVQRSSVSNPKENVSVGLNLINKNLKIKSNLPGTKTQPRAVSRRSKQKLPNVMAKFPEPSGEGGFYTVKEAIGIVNKFSQPNTSLRSKIISYLCDESCLVPVHSATFYRILRVYKKEGTMPVEWKRQGRPCLLDSEALQEMATKLSETPGKVITDDDVRDAVEEIRCKNEVAKGFAPLAGRRAKVCDRTLKKYALDLVMHTDTSIASTSISKTVNRFAAETSIVSTMSFLMVVAYCHFIILDEEDPDLLEELKEVDSDTRQLYNMVKLATNNLPISPIKSHYVFSTDDTVVYVFEGMKNRKDSKFKLVSSTSAYTSGVRAKYNHEDSNLMNGMRLKMTFTFSAAGTCAPLCVTVSGLTKQEMPNEPIIMLKVRGLCVGGSGVNVGNDRPGFVFFMRGEYKMDVRRYELYQQEILIPFINSTRNEYDSFEFKEGEPIPDRLTAVSWFDGDLCQIQNQVRSESIDLYKKNKIIACKQSASRSGTEQPADVSAVFPLLKKLSGEFTVSDLPVSSVPLKRVLLEQFKSLDDSNDLVLKLNKRKSIIDFLCTIPPITTKAVTTNNIQRGFVETGMVDPKKKRFPHFNNILSTCTRRIRLEEYQLCESSFQYLYNKYHDQGHVEDAEFYQLGFQFDTDFNGNERNKKEVPVSREWCQRAKCLTHGFQKKLRDEFARLNEVKKEKVMEKKVRAIDMYVRDNREVVKALYTMMNKTYIEGDEQFVKDCTLDHFANLKLQKLRNFVIVRNKQYKSKYLMPKKGKLDDAKGGAGSSDNCIVLAFESRLMTNFMEQELAELTSARAAHCSTTGEPSTSVESTFNVKSVDVKLGNEVDN